MSPEVSILDFCEEVDDKFWKVDKSFNIKLQKILSLASSNLYNYTELLKLNWTLDYLYNFILASIINIDDRIKEVDGCKNIKSIALLIMNYDDDKRLEIYKKKSFEKKVGRYLEKLEQMRLIKLVQIEEPGTFYKLSLNGLFYVIINWYKSPFINVLPSLLNTILKRYDDSLFLRYFLFPYFENKTLETAETDLENDILLYLEEICKAIISEKQENSWLKKELIDGMYPKHLFSWPSPDGDKRQIYRDLIKKGTSIRQFLYSELGWEWVIDAKIIPSFEKDLITITTSFPIRTATIRINRRTKFAIVEQGSRQYAKIRMSLNNDKSFSVQVKSAVNNKVLSEEALDNYCKLKLFDLIYHIRIKCRGKDRESYASVEKDKKFQTTLAHMIDVLEMSK